MLMRWVGALPFNPVWGFALQTPHYQELCSSGTLGASPFKHSRCHQNALVDFQVKFCQNAAKLFPSTSKFVLLHICKPADIEAPEYQKSSSLRLPNLCCCSRENRVAKKSSEWTSTSASVVDNLSRPLPSLFCY